MGSEMCIRDRQRIRSCFANQIERIAIYLAALPGFEPGLTAPKADVLPLHHRASESNLYETTILTFHLDLVKYFRLTAVV